MVLLLTDWVFPFTVGAVFGSFLNVCIYRIPRRLSLVSPGSHCPHCKQGIRPYDNIPIISWLILGGRCRKCGKPISIRYPVVELLAGFLTAGLVNLYAFSLDSVSYIILAYILIVVAAIDLGHLIIPNEIIAFAIVVGIVLQIAGGAPTGFTGALVGAATFSGFLYFTGVLGRALFRKQSMGFGDVKLGAAIGFFVGWKWALVAIFLAFLSAALLGAIGLSTRRVQFGQRIPFGPFLSLGTVSTLFIGDVILESFVQQIILR